MCMTSMYKVYDILGDDPSLIGINASNDTINGRTKNKDQEGQLSYGEEA